MISEEIGEYYLNTCKNIDAYKLNEIISMLVNTTPIRVSNENFEKLLKLQDVIYFETGTDPDLNDVIGRILDFYKNFVPYD